MNKDFYNLIDTLEDSICSNCEDKSVCETCRFNEIFKSIEDMDEKYGHVYIQEQDGCHICTGKNGKLKEIFYDTGRGGFQTAQYCPNCGKRLQNI